MERSFALHVICFASSTALFLLASSSSLSLFTHCVDARSTGSSMLSCYICHICSRNGRQIRLLESRIYLSQVVKDHLTLRL
jgi:hypothetical protein